MQIFAYIHQVSAAVTTDSRWQLYRLLSDPTRLRLLALAESEELSVGELAELLSESQPTVSRHASPLRKAGLLTDRKQGTRTLVRLSRSIDTDAVVADALRTGRRLCVADGSLARIAEVVARRDASAREFFSKPKARELTLPSELPAYLSAFAPLIAHRQLAIDVGTGDGAFLEILAPVFERVIGVDRSEAQLDLARARLRTRGYDHVDLIADQVDSPALQKSVGGGADLVVAARVLHHAPLPRDAMRALVRLARPGGHVLVIDYDKHDNEQFSEAQADVWLGFEASELLEFAKAAELQDVAVAALPSGLAGSAVDGSLPWLSMIGRRQDVTN